MTDNVTNPWGGHPAPHTLIHSYALCKSILTGVRNKPEALCKCMRISSRIYCHRLPRPSSPQLNQEPKDWENQRKEAWWGGGGLGWGGVSPKGTKSIQEQRHHTARHGADREELVEVMREAAHLPSCSCVSHLHDESQPWQYNMNQCLLNTANKIFPCALMPCVASRDMAVSVWGLVLLYVVWCQESGALV